MDSLVSGVGDVFVRPDSDASVLDEQADVNPDDLDRSS